MIKKTHHPLGFLLCLAMILAACGSSGDRSKSSSLVAEPVNYSDLSELNYTLVRKVNVPLENTGIQYDFQASQLVEPEDRGAEFWTLDIGNYLINVFDVEEEEYKKTIKLAADGPNGIPSLLNFHVHNSDSIYIMPVNAGVFFLVNGEGEVVKKWDYTKLELPSGESLLEHFPFPIAELGTQFFYDNQDNSLLLPLWLQPGGQDYEVPPIARIDLTNTKVAGSFGEYPDNYKGTPNSVRPHVNMVKADDGSVWLSYEESHVLQKYNRKGELILSANAKSNYLNNDFPLYKRFPNKAVREKHWIEVGFYLGVYYDPYRKLVYRIVNHGQPLKDLNGRFNKPRTAPWSIITMDLDGKVLGETPMDGSKYRANDGLHVTEEGILISTENVFNDEDQEDFLEFEIITIDVDQSQG